MQEQRFRLTSISPILFGAPVLEERKSDETHEQREARQWPSKVHQMSDGQAYIQPFALKNALESAGSRLGMKLTGKATYTKLFRQGVMVVEPMLLEKPSGDKVTIKDINPRLLFVPSDGKRGSGKRVMKIFPELMEWSTIATITVLDQRITEEVMLKHLEEAGKFIGFGSMRVENGGITGRFAVSVV